MTEDQIVALEQKAALKTLRLAHEALLVEAAGQPEHLP